jgi:hypothetical protein
MYGLGRLMHSHVEEQLNCSVNKQHNTGIWIHDRMKQNALDTSLHLRQGEAVHALHEWQQDSRGRCLQLCPMRSWQWPKTQAVWLAHFQVWLWWDAYVAEVVARLVEALGCLITLKPAADKCQGLDTTA